MDGLHPDLGDVAADLGRRWEILESGITVKLYPSCAGTHPALDALLLLRRREGYTAADVGSIEIDVDHIAPTILIHDRPSTGLEGKFSMPFCAASATVHGRVGIDTFEPGALSDPDVRALMPRVIMRVDPTFDGTAPPLTQSRVTVHLRDGRTFVHTANGARGYPEQPASDEELTTKFRSCAGSVLSRDRTERALLALQTLDDLDDVRQLTRELSGHGVRS